MKLQITDEDIQTGRIPQKIEQAQNEVQHKIKKKCRIHLYVSIAYLVTVFLPTAYLMWVYVIAPLLP